MAAIGEEEGRQLQLPDLPDDILIRILSMLPTKGAVRTCLLVLRRSGQHHLWKTLTSLQFHEFNGGSFRNFVDGVMDLRDHSVSLDSFSLEYNWKEEEEGNSIKTWITKAVQCNVEELTLSIHDILVDTRCRMANKPYCCIFGCQSLVKLDLQWITLHVPSSVICLPGLKYLRIRAVRLEGDDKSIEKFLSSPLLEKLIIYECYWGTLSINVCSPKLQVLKITHFYESSNGSKICIIGDNLKYFSYTGGLMNEYRICASSSTQLSKVEIYVNKMCEGAAPNCYEILKGLSGTRNLVLSDYFLEHLQKSSELLDTIPIFEDLTRLDIINVYSEEICIDSLALMKIYERCPRLECLNIGELSRTVRCSQMSPIPLCFQTHLKKILVHYYVPGGDGADAAIDVLLNSSPVLDELIIYCEENEVNGIHEGGRKIQEIQDRLNQRPRVSKDCIISVKGYDV